MRINQLKVLNKDEIKSIHDSSIELLGSLGVKVESDEAVKLLKEHGATVDVKEKSTFVRFPESLVTEQLKKVPDSFSLYGPDGSYQVTVNTSNLNFSTMGAAVNINDSTKKKGVRKTTLEDAINHIRIVNELEHIVCSQVDVWPHDVPFTELHCHTLREWGRHSYKPYGMACYGKTASQDMINLASIIVDGEEELIKKPRLLGVYNPTSPLLQTKILLNGLFIFAKYNQPLLISSAASAGSTSPVTLAGTLVQANMEVLSSIVLTQLINPGTPVLYGSTNTIMDPISGNPAYGSIEFSLITIASAQLAHYYNIPSKGSGALTDSKCFDVQNGFERFMTLYCAASAGHNFITCAGTYETLLSESFELLVIDDEMAGIIKRGLKGISITEETLALDQIRKVATEKKNYLMLKHTAKNTRKEIFVPKLINREKRGIWRKNGAKDIIAVAKERVKGILETQKGPDLSSNIEKQIAKYTHIVSSRSLEDYMKLEGIDNSKGSIDVAGVKIE
jgi:trimethylamine--corrinoid protein Co-methyltransferase